jgi:hypothetical protein
MILKSISKRGGDVNNIKVGEPVSNVHPMVKMPVQTAWGDAYSYRALLNLFKPD